VFVCVAVVIVESSFAADAPELPQLYVGTTYLQPSGRTIAVRAGGDLQASLNGARPGDVITLEGDLHGTVHTAREARGRLDHCADERA